MSTKTNADLMAYLCRLAMPPGGVVPDLFMGSGSTGKAAVAEGFRFIGCELSDEYAQIAKSRIAHAAATSKPKPTLVPESDKRSEWVLEGSADDDFADAPMCGADADFS